MIVRRFFPVEDKLEDVVSGASTGRTVGGILSSLTGIDCLEEVGAAVGGLIGGLFDGEPEPMTAEAMNALGLRYHNGDGVEQNFEKAFSCFCKSSDAGCAAASRNIGWCYEFGQSVDQDYEKAEEWYRYAIARGYDAGADLERVRKKKLKSRLACLGWLMLWFGVIAVGVVMIYRLF